MAFTFIKPLTGKIRSFISQVMIAFSSCIFLLTFTNSTHAQTTEPYNWGSVAIGGGGFVSGIITSKTQPGLIYARTDVGGAYRWDAINSKWIPLVDFASENQQGFFGVESIATDAKNPKNVYLSAGISYFNSGKSYILRSADYGATFSIVDVTAQFKINGNGNGRGNGERLQVDPVNSAVLYCGTRANGLFQSTNSGTTWTKMSGLDAITTNNGNGINLVVMDSSTVTTVNGVKQTQRMFVGVSRMGNKNLYRSDDAGATFTPIQPPAILDTTMMPHRAVLASNGNLFVTYANGAGPGGTTAEPCNTGQIWKYTIATNTWTNITPLTATNRQNRAYSGISVDPNNPNRLIASTTNTYLLQYSNIYGDRFYYSTDGGTTWVDVVARGFTLDPNGITWVTGQSLHWGGSIEFDPSNTNRVFVVSGNGVFVNNDITATAGVWSFTVKGLEETVPQNLVSINGGPFLSVISDYDGFRHTNAAVYAPVYNPRIGSTTGLDYAVNNNNKVVRVGSSMYYSTDQGVTWTKTTGTLKGTSGQVALSADGNILLHCPNGSTSTYRSTDNGATWTTVTGLSISSARPVADGSNASKFYAYNSSTGPMMVSTDGGVSFASAGNPGSGGSKIVRTIPGREGHIWVALYNGGLTHSEDSGTSFTKTTNVTTCSAVGFGKALTAGSYETIYIYGTVNGVLGIHRSTDKGTTWVRVNDDAHQYGGPANGQFVQGDLNVYGRVYMSTAGRGIAFGSVISAKTPTDIGLSSTSIIQNNPVGAAIGTFSSTSVDKSATFTYSLVSGAGSEDNAAFSITGAQLNAGIVFNYNTKKTYNIRVKTVSDDGISFEKNFVVNVTTFTLPVKNFSIIVTNETCSNNNDGKINITAAQSLNYKATLTANNVSTDYTFTGPLEISPLAAGVYTLCISVTGQPDYKQCYDLTVTEPKPLSVYTAVDLPGKNIVINLAGASSYQIKLNNKIFTTTANIITLSLARGRNDILVSTDKPCQGTFTKTLFIDDGKSVYPNPFDNILSVNLGKDPSRSVKVSVYNMAGTLAYAKDITVQNAVASMDLSNLKSGNYIIKIKTDLGESSSKISKK